MWSINKLNEIRMTRGDTPSIGLVLTIEHDKKKYQYVPSEDDYIVFALAEKGGSGPILVKEIKDMTLCFSEDDTRDFPEGEYEYEISINSGDYRCTFISAKRFILNREIYTSKNPNSQRSGPAPETELEKLVGVIPSGSQMQGQILLPTSILVDPTLTQSGKAADAKAVGKALSRIIESGNGGSSAREIEIRRTEDYIQWRYTGDEEWQDLISIEELTGKPGEPGKDYTLTDADKQYIASLVEVNEVHEYIENPYNDKGIKEAQVQINKDLSTLTESVNLLKQNVETKLTTIESLIDQLIILAGGSV